MTDWRQALIKIKTQKPSKNKNDARVTMMAAIDKLCNDEHLHHLDRNPVIRPDSSKKTVLQASGKTVMEFKKLKKRTSYRAKNQGHGHHRIQSEGLAALHERLAKGRHDVLKEDSKNYDFESINLEKLIKNDKLAALHERLTKERHEALKSASKNHDFAVINLRHQMKV